jgi:hypothetical protein
VESPFFERIGTGWGYMGTWSMDAHRTCQAVWRFGVDLCSA